MCSFHLSLPLVIIAAILPPFGGAWCHRTQHHFRSTTPALSSISTLRSNISLASHHVVIDDLRLKPPTATVVTDSMANATPATNPSTNTFPPQSPPSAHTLHLLSLPAKNDTFYLPGESLVRECWRWKDATLGDGRDYFVPRPRALKAFHSLFVGVECQVDLTSAVSDSNDNTFTPSQVLLRLPPCPLPDSKNKLCPTDISLSLLPQSHAVDPKLFSKTPGNRNCSIMKKPTTAALSTTKTSFVVEECAVLSNCARLDVILVLRQLKHENISSKNEAVATALTKKEAVTSRGPPQIAAEIAARHAVAFHLHRQINSKQQSKQNASLIQRSGLSSWLDLPGAVDVTAPYVMRQNNKDLNPSSLSPAASTATTTAATSTISAEPISSAVIAQNKNIDNDKKDDICLLANRLTSLYGAASISTHLSLIASGLSPRPNRPDRSVLFRPYSSRDAHILLQLKRTAEVVSVLREPYSPIRNAQSSSSWLSGQNSRLVKNRNKGGGRIKTLLDGALTAGKAARNEDIVPEIKKLKEFGSDGTPPIGLSNIVAEAAMERAVKPTVEKCVARLIAMETSNQISFLRKRVNEIVISLANTKRTSPAYYEDCIYDDDDADAFSKDSIFQRKQSHKCGKRGDENDCNMISVTCSTTYIKRLQKWANQLLHEPTMQLREGQHISEVDMKETIQRIETQLREKLYRELNENEKKLDVM